MINKSDTYNSSLLDELINGIDKQEQNKIDKKMQLAARIADTIKAKGWSKKEFAQKMAKAPSEISKWLSGTHNFQADTLFDIESTLGIELIRVEEPGKEILYTQTFQIEASVSAYNNPKEYIAFDSPILCGIITPNAEEPSNTSKKQSQEVYA